MKLSDVQKQEAIRLRVEEHKSLSEIVKLTGISKSTLSVLLRDYPVDDSFLDEKRLSAWTKGMAIRSESQANKLDTEILEARSEFSLMLDERLTTITKVDRGMLGELYTKYILSKLGFQFLEPRLLLEALDLVVIGQSGKFYRCEIKSSGIDSLVHVSRTKYDKDNPLKYQSVGYTKEDNVDLFIVLDLNLELIAVIPAWELIGKPIKFKLNPRTRFWKYVNRFDLFS